MTLNFPLAILVRLLGATNVFTMDGFVQNKTTLTDINASHTRISHPTQAITNINLHTALLPWFGSVHTAGRIR
jgi:hypothetical protein